MNPAIDSNGITADEMDETGDDFREDYLSGVYDVQCAECHGNNVVERLADGAPAELVASWEQWQQDEYDYRAECAMEARMFA